MKSILGRLGGLTLLLTMLSLFSNALFAQEMDKMWGERVVISKKSAVHTDKGKLFRDGKYAMFIHWGLYSQLANKWGGKTYYGIGEWMMDKGMANLTTPDYVPIARDFNPKEFDAKYIVQLAKNAGMKYIIITAKHHDGFAMYDSKASDFNIVKATPFKRDPMKELAKACADAGMGFGFYYSHNQDWTTPYGTIFNAKDNLDPKSFESYFRHKCLPQVEEITTNYGPIELVWFDTPGSMKKEYIEELVAVVRKNQPNAFVSGRAGHGLGDYNTLGDMEIPLSNVDGLWEAVDVSNDAWGYTWYDNNWKEPKEILRRLISTVARGGTYMLNIGPDGKGSIPDQQQKTLLAVGEWLKRYPDVIYQAESSPWQHALPWGDITKNKNKLFLNVYSWPNTGRLYIPGLQTPIKKARLLTGVGTISLASRIERGWTVLDIPYAPGDQLVSVIELELSGDIKIDSTLALDPQGVSTFAAEFSEAGGVEKSTKGWMEKFGEWKHVTQVTDWKDKGTATWTINVLKPGYYQTELEYSGEGRLVWRIDQKGGQVVQNQQNSSAIYNWQPMGWMYFAKPGTYHIAVSLVEGNRKSASLSGLRFTPIRF
ncbi:alpha-L-fucosidase [Sphingobacterium detergens]